MSSPIDDIMDNVSEMASSVGSLIDEGLGTSMFSVETAAAVPEESDDEGFSPIEKKGGGAAFDGEDETIVEYATYNPGMQSEDDDDSVMTDDSDFDCYRKFDEEKVNMTLEQYHPNLKQEKYQDVLALSKVILNESGNVVDEIHKTLPFLTKFERAKVLGLRAKQLADGAEAFIEVPSNIIESYVIAEMELNAKVLPFIISRPLPNGSKEFWKLKDLDLVDY